ncbi:phosphotransferase [Defluviimonas sp. D31]|uniref:aminoglycoside phosphotransferase family protein n=1 Tax=Defluviimonas sp. D31 TaxID=3083253 RepID=UPI00296E82E3|nr:phosphotransferase [Defluviimonas sp. D31]MDW4549123.1 phosphotransferase [Defluviimonas sp. D31]
MTDRTNLARQFLATAGWSGADRAALAGDASARRYERLRLDGRPAVLMDAPPERGESTERFARMADWLSGHGYSAPAILAADHDAGFLLLEDLGDALVARLVAEDPKREPPLYAAATDFLADLHRHAPPDFVAPLDGPALAEFVALTPRWYLPGIGAAETQAGKSLPEQVAETYRRLADPAMVTALRDFHAENLIWLPDRKGPARLGLLDFQDAVVAHPAYDLVSLLQDARRDVTPATEAEMLDRYTTATGRDADQFAAIYALLGAQRALRIVGVFARLTLHFGKPHYLGYLPRVWGYLLRNLAHPALADLARTVAEALPEPTPERVQRIKDQCGSYQTP